MKYITQKHNYSFMGSNGIHHVCMCLTQSIMLVQLGFMTVKVYSSVLHVLIQLGCKSYFILRKLPTTLLYLAIDLRFQCFARDMESIFPFRLGSQN
jgi:hypothetical protein